MRYLASRRRMNQSIMNPCFDKRKKKKKRSSKHFVYYSLLRNAILRIAYCVNSKEKIGLARLKATRSYWIRMHYGNNTLQVYIPEKYKLYLIEFRIFYIATIRIQSAITVRSRYGVQNLPTIFLVKRVKYETYVSFHDCDVPPPKIESI